MKTEERREEVESWVKEALSKTNISSAPGPDGISYRIIKLTLNTPLGRELMEEVVDNLRAGRIPKSWQHSKVVMIPKPGKDHKTTKGWRPINLINCIGKLGETAPTSIWISEREISH